MRVGDHAAGRNGISVPIQASCVFFGFAHDSVHLVCDKHAPESLNPIINKIEIRSFPFSLNVITYGVILFICAVRLFRYVCPGPMADFAVENLKTRLVRMKSFRAE